MAGRGKDNSETDFRGARPPTPGNARSPDERPFAREGAQISRKIIAEASTVFDADELSDFESVMNARVRR